MNARCVHGYCIEKEITMSAQCVGSKTKPHRAMLVLRLELQNGLRRNYKRMIKKCVEGLIHINRMIEETERELAECGNEAKNGQVS